MKLMTGNKIYDIMIIEVRRGCNAERQEGDGIYADVRIPATKATGHTGGQDNIGHDSQVY